MGRAPRCGSGQGCCSGTAGTGADAELEPELEPELGQERERAAVVWTVTGLPPSSLPGAALYLCGRDKTPPPSRPFAGGAGARQPVTTLPVKPQRERGPGRVVSGQQQHNNPAAKRGKTPGEDVKETSR